MVGLIHAFWHLPLFWVVGTNQIKMGFGTDFWIFVAFVLTSSVFSAWCYLGNGRSIMAAALLHTAGNLNCGQVGFCVTQEQRSHYGHV